mgnify:CR=1 FL=1
MQRPHLSEYNRLRNRCEDLRMGSGKRVWLPIEAALDTLAAAIENLKEGTK